MSTRFPYTTLFRSTGNVAAECFTTVKQPSTPTTASSPTGGNVVPGTSVTDTATIAGAAGQPTPTGTVKIGRAPRTAAEWASGGAQAGTAVVRVNGGATQAAVTGATTRNYNSIGQYCWRAVYSGDGFYNGSPHTGSVAAECFTAV